MWQKQADITKNNQGNIDPESINLILDEINRLASLVKRLVVFSRPIYKNLIPTHINQVIEEMVSLIDFESSGKKVLLKKKYYEGLPLINADPNSLKQLLINIITNSLESIDKSGEIVIETTFNKEKSMIAVEISDTGKGIPDDILGNIFDPFFTSKETGTGLGLSISHEIVTAHGGKISFQKNNGKGTRCIIWFPIIK